jgi:DNA-binding NarL/FixJ family response regulator
MKLLLIDDHVLFREGVVELLTKRLAEALEIRQAGSCEEAFDLLERTGAVDLVLIDLGLPGMPGLEGIARFRERHAETPVVALSSADDRETVLAALDAGAMGFIPKKSTADVMVGAIGLIRARGIYLPPDAFLSSRTDAADMAGPRVAPPASGGHTDPSQLGLTPRQADVLYQILEGKSEKAIARALGLQPGTVKAHTSVVLRSLNVTTRTQAVIAANRLNLRFSDAPA